MSNVLLAYPNIADSGTLSGGSWAAGMPVGNLQDRVIKNAARSSSTHASATTFTLTYAAAALVGFIALVAHNLSTAAKVRFRGFSSAPPTLDVDFTSGVLDSRFTCTRSGTNATFVGSNGLVQTAGANVARFEYDPTTLLCRGLLVEPTATNLCLRSSDLANATWTKTTMTATKNATGPDGVASRATTLYCSGADGSCKQTVTVAAGTFYVSAWVRRKTGTGAVYFSGDILGAGWGANIAGSIGSAWTRIKLAAVTATNPQLGFRITVPTDEIEVALCQLEVVCHTSPIETTSATVTRNGDLIQATSTNFSSWYSQTEGTFAVAFTLLGAPPASTAALYSASSDSTHFVGASVSTARSVEFDVTNATAQAAIGATVVAADTLSYIASAYKVNDFATSLNAAAASTDAAGTLPTPTSLTLGQQSGTVANNAAMVLAKLRYWPLRMSNANLASISTSTFDIAADYDSGLLDALPAAYVAATTAAQRASLVQSTPHKLSTPQTLRYWRCDITDAANSAGYVQIGRLMVADTAFQPTYNASYGASIGWADRAVVSEADSGAEYFYERPKYRVFKAAMDWLTEAEGIAKVLEMQRTLGTTGEVYAMFDPDETTYLPNRSFLARMRTLGALETPLYGVWRTGFELKELL